MGHIVVRGREALSDFKSELLFKKGEELDIYKMKPPSSGPLHCQARATPYLYCKGLEFMTMGV